MRNHDLKPLHNNTTMMLSTPNPDVAAAVVLMVVGDVGYLTLSSLHMGSLSKSS
jgi:hypothetical protein